MWNYDGWESEFKLGIVTPHADIGPEAEAQAMLDGMRATVHGARVDFSPMHPGGTIDEKIAHDPVLQFVAPEVIDRTVESLSSSPLDAIGLAFTSSSFKVGPAREGELLARLATVSHGIRLNTTATAAADAVRQFDLDRLANMAPTWFCRWPAMPTSGNSTPTSSRQPRAGPPAGRSKSPLPQPPTPSNVWSGAPERRRSSSQATASGPLAPSRPSRRSSASPF